MYSVEEIAQVTHEANRALQMVEQNPTIPVSLPWSETDEETKQSSIDGVQNIIDGATPEQSHENWMKFKLDHGWKFGPMKDEARKEHPLLIPYAELPESQKLKDKLFHAIVHAFMDEE